MSKKKRGLGALGVDVLLSATSRGPEHGAGGASLHNLPVERICRSPFQPRKAMEPGALEALADSIRRQGLVQPVVVRRVADEYQLIAGERRWRAAQQAGLQEIPAVIQEASDQEAAAIALIENLQREDLNPLEEARAFSSLIENFNLTHQQVGEAVGRSRASVSNSLRLLALPGAVQEMLNQGHIEMGHARALLALNEPDQLSVAQTVIRRKLSVRATEERVKRIQSGHAGSGRGVTRPDPDIVHMEQKLSDRLGAGVKIRHYRNGSGQVSIRYASLDEFGGIVEKLIPEQDTDSLSTDP